MYLEVSIAILDAVDDHLEIQSGSLFPFELCFYPVHS